MSETFASTRAQIVALLPRLRRFARTLTRHREDADDLVQLALERALSRLAQWRPEERLDGWLFGIVRNAWIDEVRTRQRWNRVVAPGEEAAAVGDTAAESIADRLSIEAALAGLPEEQRSAVALVLIEGLSYKEAAHVLDVPIGTLTSRLARARETLQSVLGATGS
jgi:RNA polymerase sigma-70 factor (ECF subfamily)